MFKPEKIPGIVANFYNGMAAKGFSGLYQRLAKGIVSEIKSGNILDIGTGPGYLPIEIARLNGQLNITGIDLSSRMINIAKENARSAKKEIAEFEVADAHELPFSNDSFDLVFSSMSFHHWRDRDMVFKEIIRVLKNNCSAYIWDFRKDVTGKEFRKTIMSNSFYGRYLSLALKFHGLKTDEWKSLSSRFPVKWNGALLCLTLRKND
ncbi:MAG TPA: class I SAM-dependent methyltransferase [bacterium]|nr:class I SAM-dependent methyltransferase [bacterium]